MNRNYRLVVIACLFGTLSLGKAALPALSGSETNSSLLLATYIVKEFCFIGNTVFSTAELAQVLQSFTNRPLSRLDLDEARVKLTLWYVHHGYVNSGAVLHEHNVQTGRVVFRIVEGRLVEIKLQGNRWVNSRFYRRRLLAHGGDPLNVNEVRNTLQVWRETYPVEQVNADIQPGALPGEAVMNLKVKEKFPYHLGMQYANSKPPSTGAEQVDALVRVESLTGRADALSLDYGVVRGNDGGLRQPKLLGVDDLTAVYTLPITVRATTVGVHYGRNSAAIVEAPFDQLDIESQMESYGVTLSQPLFYTPSRQFFLSLTGERRSSQTSLLGVPYSLSPGAVNGESAESVLRLAAQFALRNAQQAFTARLAFNGGLDVLGATRNGRGPDGRFFSVVSQTQYLRRLGKTRHELLLRFAGQYATDPLLSLEQFAIGGAHTVRGYRENTMVRDQGLVASVELHLPLWVGKAEQAVLQLAPFTDFGAGWDEDNPTLFNELASAGAGIIFTPHKNVQASLFWGYPFRRVEYRNSSLQDLGIHFRLTVWAF